MTSPRNYPGFSDRATETTEPLSDISNFGPSIASRVKESSRDVSTSGSSAGPSRHASVPSSPRPEADGFGPCVSGLGCIPPIKQYADDDADYPDADYFNYTTMSLAEYQAFKVEFKTLPLPYSALKEMSEEDKLFWGVRNGKGRCIRKSLQRWLEQ